MRSAFSVHLADQLFEAVDVRAELEGLLPPRLEGLDGPLTGLTRVSATNVVEQLLASDGFAVVWEGANRRAHAAAVAVLRGDDVGPVSAAVGAIVRNSENESVGRAVAMVTTMLLRDIAWTGMVAGIVITIAVAVFGRPLVSPTWRRGEHSGADVDA